MMPVLYGGSIVRACLTCSILSPVTGGGLRCGRTIHCAAQLFSRILHPSGLWKKMDRAQTLKDLGNEAFGQQNWQRADALYTEALVAVAEASDPPARELKGTLHSNRCVARLRLERITDALTDADACASLREGWPRAHLRRAEALERLGRVPEAVDACQRALQLGKDEQAQHRLRQLQAMQSGRFSFRQLLTGRELCAGAAEPQQQLVWQFATQMKNHIYVVGDLVSRKCIIVDPCWDVKGIVQAAEQAGLTIAAAALTHYHFDHSGGIPPPPYNGFGIVVEGVADICKRFNVPVYVGHQDVPKVLENNGVPKELVRGTENLDYLHFGADGVRHERAAAGANVASATAEDAARDEGLRIRFLHTPGHTPGSQCLLLNGRHLLSGDTLFIKSCGRLDLPDCDSRKMYFSLQSLRQLPNEVVVWPGHDYGGASTSIAQEKAAGFLRDLSLDQWLQMH
eukprot:TRINITY_DN3734_c0_g1_i1.p1 TRINITY_DN3734_c0_g1~~TRINITY_DN3734_c0_g1_i1.p1  ORF type:complete len:455 (-),score=76.53 TRINITY_DN3734_c0_g1_i1:8-1372(-)